MKDTKERVPLLTVKCLVYNHEPFLRQCLDGFVMQETDFPFEVIVHDDASTDGSAAIIREYAEKYPHIIRPVYENENLYSKHDGSLNRLVNGMLHPATKYVALCEGDDYWIDKRKLQTQVSFLETHPECTMCCNRTLLYSEKHHRVVGENYCHNKSCDLRLRDVVNRTGLYISTCSIVYRLSVKENFPDYGRRAPVGDYPVQIWCALKGTIHYFNQAMSVYRVDNAASWIGRQNWNSGSRANVRRIRLMVEMFRGFARDFKEHAPLFHNKIAQYVNYSSPRAFSSPEENKAYFEAFGDVTAAYSPRWKWDLYLRTHSHFLSRIYVAQIFPRLMRGYRPRRKFYNSH